MATASRVTVTTMPPTVVIQPVSPLTLHTRTVVWVIHCCFTAHTHTQTHAQAFPNLFPYCVFAIVNGIMPTWWSGSVTFNFLNLWVCEGPGCGVAGWLAGMGPRGVDFISHPGEKEENLGEISSSLSLPLCLLLLSLLHSNPCAVLAGWCLKESYSGSGAAWGL